MQARGEGLVFQTFRQQHIPLPTASLEWIHEALSQHASHDARPAVVSPLSAAPSSPRCVKLPQPAGQRTRALHCRRLAPATPVWPFAGLSHIRVERDKPDVGDPAAAAGSWDDTGSTTRCTSTHGRLGGRAAGRSRCSSGGRHMDREQRHGGAQARYVMARASLEIFSKRAGPTRGRPGFLCCRTGRSTRCTTPRTDEKSPGKAEIASVLQDACPFSKPTHTGACSTSAEPHKIKRSVG